MFNFSRATYKEKLDYMKRIDYLTESDINRKRPTLEDISRIHPSLNEFNPLLYTIYLQKNPDIDETEKMYYSQVIEKLMKKEKEIVDSVIKNMRNSSEN